MRSDYYVKFTPEMKETHTILMPNMLPLQFRFIMQVLRNNGYRAQLLETQGPEIVETGLKYVHNDACYPALLIIGQFINALQSGQYDPHKTALIYFQTGGGCRASNYISLLRKALARAGYEYVPVISVSMIGIEQHPGFSMNLSLLKQLALAILYGDLMMMLDNQCRPYERTPGASALLAQTLTDRITDDMKLNGARMRSFDRTLRMILAEYARLDLVQRPCIQVGVVGEIYVKYSPLGNNNLIDFLVNEGAECTVPGLMDFFLFYIYHHVSESDLYGRERAKQLIFSVAYRLLLGIQHRYIRIIREHGRFRAPNPFERTVAGVRDFIGLGCKMGEGWLLPAEMLELYHANVKNIVCTQPFGCLPNHICGKGMMKPLKDKYPDMNIVAVDYDPGATRVNQENRIKLMLANARMAQQ